MCNKKVLIITTLFVLFSSCYSKNSVNKDVQDYYVNQSRIIGTSYDGNLLGMLLQKRNTGKADIKYTYKIFDTNTSLYVDELNPDYICSFYNEESILTDWNDQKYDMDSYLNLQKDKIEAFNYKYKITPMSLMTIDNASCEIKKVVRDETSLIQTVDLDILLIVDDKTYSGKLRLKEQEVIEKVEIEEVVSFSDCFVLKICKYHSGFEDDKYIDFEYLSIKK